MVPVASPNKSLCLRRAYLNDLDSIVEIGRKTFFETYFHHFSKNFTLTALNEYLDSAFSPSQIQNEYMSPDSQFYILKENQKTLGYMKISGINITDSDSHTPLLILDRIYIDSSLQGQGIGRQLMDFVFGLAKENNKISVQLQCWVDHRKSLKFYQNYGFQIVNKITFPIKGTAFIDSDYILERQVG